MSLATALTLARQGFAVFPVVGKRPITPKGVYSASTDPRVFARWDWGRGVDCGVATGAVSGIDVLDVDVRSGDAQTLVGRENSSSPSPDVNGFVTLAQLGAALPETRAASTPNGGRHYWFRHIDGSRSRKLGAGLEWFSDKKLVVVPPAQGREWLNDADVADAPDWLKGLVLAPFNHGMQGCRGNSSGPLVANPNSSNISHGTGQVPRQIYLLIVRGMRGATPKVQRRVRGLWANLAVKRQHRNDGLNYTAWQFREFIKTGDLDQEIAARLLWKACEANGYLTKDGPDVVKAVIHRVIYAHD